MKYTRKLIKDRIDWLKMGIKLSKEDMQGYINKAENISSHIKVSVEEMEELNESLKKLK